MIFGNKSELMLKYQKAKAKLVEYNTPVDEYPHFTHNSNELSYPTTYVLSRYAECIAENDFQEIAELSPLLVATAQYYDAAVNSKDRKIYDFLVHRHIFLLTILEVLKYWRKKHTPRLRQKSILHNNYF